MCKRNNHVPRFDLQQRFLNADLGILKWFTTKSDYCDVSNSIPAGLLVCLLYPYHATKAATITPAKELTTVAQVANPSPPPVETKTSPLATGGPLLFPPLLGVEGAGVEPSAIFESQKKQKRPTLLCD